MNVVSLGIFGFMVAGNIGGAFQHLLMFENVAKDLTPFAFANRKDTDINPAAKFWGGDFAAALFFSNSIMAVAYSRNALVREAYLVATGCMFSLFAVTWLRKGAEVGNTENMAMVLGMDSFLGGLALVGAYLTRRVRLSQRPKAE